MGARGRRGLKGADDGGRAGPPQTGVGQRGRHGGRVTGAVGEGGAGGGQTLGGGGGAVRRPLPPLGLDPVRQSLELLGGIRLPLANARLEALPALPPPALPPRRGVTGGFTP